MIYINIKEYINHLSNRWFFYPKNQSKMKPKIPFRIRSQYEKWEFDLEVIDTDFKIGVDCYWYLGKVKKFLNLIPDKTELIFEMDRLEIVILTFNNMNLTILKDLCDKMERLFGKPTKDECFNYNNRVFTNKNKSYYCYPVSNSSFKVMYGISAAIPIYYIFWEPCIKQNAE